MKKLTLITATAIALASAAHAEPVTVEYFGLFDPSCSCSRAGLKVDGEFYQTGALTKRGVVNFVAENFGADTRIAFSPAGGGGWDDLNGNGLIDTGETSGADF